MDVTHVAWHRCPVEEKHLNTGKEGFPTRAFEVVVDHTRRILYCSVGYRGAMNDKSIVKYNDFVCALRDNNIYQDKTFRLNAGDGVFKEYTGAWVLVDGGYNRWACTQCPANKKTCSTVPDVFSWSKHVESVRKDVECTFGILKRRFAALKHGFNCTTSWQITLMFRAACILHNRIHTHDAMYAEWRDLVEEVEEERAQQEECEEAAARRLDADDVRSDDEGDDQARENVRGGPGAEHVEVEVQPNFHHFRAALIKHHALEMEAGRIKWLMTSRSCRVGRQDLEGVEFQDV
jgi:hypothetical protein